MTEKGLREQIQLDAGVLLNPYWGGQRITELINKAQEWLQVKLIKQGYKNWKKPVNVTFAETTYLGIEINTIDLPADFLYEMPVEFIYHSEYTKPAREVENNNFYDVVNNAVLTPTLNAPAFMMMDTVVYTYPRISGGGSAIGVMVYTRKVTDMIYEDDSTASEIPTEQLGILIERVVMQIKSTDGMEQIKQAKLAEIDKELVEKYQLDQAKKTDKEQTQ